MTFHYIHENSFWATDALAFASEVPEGTWVLLPKGYWAVSRMSADPDLTMLLWVSHQLDEVPKEIRTQLLLLGVTT